MTPLREKMIRDMQIKGFSPKTQNTYLTNVTSYAKSPEDLGDEDIKNYLYYCKKLRSKQNLHQWSLQRLKIPLHNYSRKKVGQDMTKIPRTKKEKTIKYYGILSSRNKNTKLKMCQHLLGIFKKNDSCKKSGFEELLMELKGINYRKCPHCQNGVLIRISEIEKKIWAFLNKGSYSCCIKI